MANNDNLTPAQKRAIVALLTERDIRTAAAAAKVGERTLHRWLEYPAFRAELTRQEGEALAEVTRGLLAMQGAALVELADLVEGCGVAPGVQLQAIRTALEYNLRYRELNNLEARIAALEDKQ